MIEQQTIEDRVRAFVLKQFVLARQKGLNPEDRWLESGLLDSLGILDLVHFLEEEFSIQIADEELVPENFQSLSAVCSFVVTKKGSAG